MNIVILTIGRCGSTIVCRMLESLGWNLNSASTDQYAEPPRIRKINEKIIVGKPVSVKQLEKEMTLLKDPWVLKDPRFVLTLPRWTVVESFNCATLLLLERDLSHVKNSLRKQGWGKSTKKGYTLRGGFTLEELHERSNDLFNKWDGPKLKIQYENIHDAINLFDLNRGDVEKRM